MNFVYRVFQGFNFLIVIEDVFDLFFFVIKDLVLFLLAHYFHHNHQLLELKF